MAFQFSLQGVLRLRQTVERREEMRLQYANRQVATVRAQIESMDLHLRERALRWHQELNDGTFASELQFELAGESSVRFYRADLSKDLKRLEALRDQQREVFQQARASREIMESIRERQLEIYRQEKSRREQRYLDDLFLMQRKRSSQG